MNSAKGRGFNSSRLVAGCCAGVVGLAPGWRRHHGIVASPKATRLHGWPIAQQGGLSREQYHGQGCGRRLS